MDSQAFEGALLLGLLLVVYFVPTLVAMLREHHQTAAIAILNILLGWTLIGWVAALVWSATAIKSSPGVDELVTKGS